MSTKDWPLNEQTFERGTLIMEERESGEKPSKVFLYVYTFYLFHT